MKKVYAVFHDNKWMVYYKRKDAIKQAKITNGQIRFLSWALWRDCGYSMDAPTFFAQSDLLSFC